MTLSVLLRRPWMCQPYMLPRLADRFVPKKQGFVFLPSMGFNSLLGGQLSLSQINAGYSGSRFLAREVGTAIRLYADSAGNNDDRLMAPFATATATAGPLTTVVVVYPAKNSNWTQYLFDGYYGGGNGHHVQMSESSESITVGYDGGNGYERKASVSLATWWGKPHTIVISTLPGVAISASVDGISPTSWSNSVSHVGAGSLANLKQAYTGTAQYSNYYHFNGFVFLWANLPGVFLSQAEASCLSTMPWSLFASQTMCVSLPIGGSLPPQLLAPISDIAKGAWTPSSGSDLYAMLDEGAADAADYIVATSPTSCEMRLSVGATPSASGDRILRYCLLPGTGSIAAELRQGSTTLAAWGPHHLTASAQDFAQTLTAGQAAAITDYSDLRVVFTAS